MKAINRFVLAALFPMTALAITSCDGAAVRKVLNYTEAKEFVAEHYDEHALDAVPVSYTNNINNMYYEIDLEYETSAGLDKLAFGFGGNHIHITTHDKFAYTLSSTMLDEIERYNSIAESLSIQVIGVVPVALDYIQDGDKMIIELGIAPGQAANFIVKMVSLAAGAIGVATDVFGFVEPENGKSELSKFIRKNIPSEYQSLICEVINYYAFTINTSSTSSGDRFLVDVETDKNGYFEHFTAITGGSFDINGFFSKKIYASEEPYEGEKPIKTSDPYFFHIKGSIDFDVSASAAAENK